MSAEKKSDLHVFISFKREEREIARKVKDALMSSGYDVWWDDKLQCGEKWYSAIDESLKSSGAVVVLWSTLAVQSQWVRHEASYAIAKDVYAPIRLDGVPLESPFNVDQAQDLYPWDGTADDPNFKKLLVRLRQLLPLPVPLKTKVWNFAKANFAFILLSIVAVVALAMLYFQGDLLEQQSSRFNDQIKEMGMLRNEMKTIVEETKLSTQMLNSTNFPIDSIDLSIFSSNAFQGNDYHDSVPINLYITSDSRVLSQFAATAGGKDIDFLFSGVSFIDLNKVAKKRRSSTDTTRLRSNILFFDNIFKGLPLDPFQDQSKFTSINDLADKFLIIDIEEKYISSSAAKMSCLLINKNSLYSFTSKTYHRRGYRSIIVKLPREDILKFKYRQPYFDRNRFSNVHQFWEEYRDK